jgi:hypothetical protein
MQGPFDMDIINFLFPGSKTKEGNSPPIVHKRFPLYPFLVLSFSQSYSPSSEQPNICIDDSCYGEWELHGQYQLLGLGWELSVSVKPSIALSWD